MICNACQKNIQTFDYKNPKELRQFLNQELEIKNGKYNNLCKKHQRRITQAIKKARELALLPTSSKQERQLASNF